MTNRRVPDGRSPTRPDSTMPPGSARADGPCPKCRCLVLVAVCARAGCGRSTAVCWGCPGVAEAFTASTGLCPACRKPKDAERSTDRNDLHPPEGAVVQSSKVCMGVTGGGQSSAQPGCCSLRETPVQRRSNVQAGAPARTEP